MTNADIIATVPVDALKARFKLSRQLLSRWRKDGVPLNKRIAFARLAAEHGRALPQSFFDEADK
jgi:hypothetical protein